MERTGADVGGVGVDMGAMGEPLMGQMGVAATVSRDGRG